MADHPDSRLPEWMHDALRAPVETRDGARARIMDAISGLPAPRRLRAPAGSLRHSHWMRRGLLSPVGGLLTTALLLATVLVRVGPLDTLLGGASADVRTAVLVLGDSVVPVTEDIGVANDLPFASKRPPLPLSRRVLDTLRIVEFVLRGGSTVHAASVLGSFNAWQRSATPMVASADGAWRVRVLIPRDVLATSLNVAFLVNGAKLLPATASTAHNLAYPE
ncbi:MAG: hypothetical protein IT353_04955 [Gemmatimonadaceae bacterium]|nr:hypothetical protein [Gemmatimonadaceae bacterium]